MVAATHGVLIQGQVASRGCGGAGCPQFASALARGLSKLPFDTLRPFRGWRLLAQAFTLAAVKCLGLLLLPPPLPPPLTPPLPSTPVHQLPAYPPAHCSDVALIEFIRTLDEAQAPADRFVIRGDLGDQALFVKVRRQVEACLQYDVQIVDCLVWFLCRGRARLRTACCIAPLSSLPHRAAGALAGLHSAEGHRVAEGAALRAQARRLKG